MVRPVFFFTCEPRIECFFRLEPETKQKVAFFSSCDVIWVNFEGEKKNSFQTVSKRNYCSKAKKKDNTESKKLTTTTKKNVGKTFSSPFLNLCDFILDSSNNQVTSLLKNNRGFLLKFRHGWRNSYLLLLPGWPWLYRSVCKKYIQRKCKVMFLNYS